MTLRTLKIAALTLAAATGTLIAGATAAPTPAEAKKVIVIKHGHHHFHGHRHFRHGGGIFLASTVVGGGSCYWLKVRAEETGRRYWWNRYYACRGE